MLIIKNAQVKAFGNAALKNFEEEMVRHVKEFFPNHYRMIRENELRTFINYAFLRAKEYGFTTKRNVCLYLNNMLALGSNFDHDPLYPWVYDILKEKTRHSPIARID